MNSLIQEMVKIAEETSAALDGEYTSVELVVLRSQERTTINFRGYTPAGGHTEQFQTLEAVAAVILPDKNKLLKKAQELREEADAIERTAGASKRKEAAKVEALAGGAK